VEERWAYFLAFGTIHVLGFDYCVFQITLVLTTLTGVPSSALCMWGSTLANAALFAFVYPSVSTVPVHCYLTDSVAPNQYIIMAMHGAPTPSNPYNPSVKIAPHHSHHHHSPQFDAPPEIRYPSPFIPIRLPVFAPVLWINDRIVQMLNIGGSQRNVHGKAASAKVRRFSDSTVESVEEGDGDNAGAYGMQGTPGPTLRMGLDTRLGTRRKAE
jgi:etoposide-induced 2.4 mRNA